MRRLLMTVDLTYRGMDYRIHEEYRERGGRVTYLSPTSMPLACSWCEKAIKHGSRLVLASIYGMHPGCAIRRGLLVPVGKSERTDAAPSPVPPSGAGGA